jgi:Rrf2 family protein
MLSQKAKYGLKALVYLARNPSPTGVRIADIAQSESIPRKFLDAILLELKKDGIVASRIGRAGGYRLAQAPETICIGQVIRVLDGPLAPIPCASRTAYRPCPDCKDVDACLVRRAMQEARDAMAGVLDGLSLADLIANNAPLGTSEPYRHYTTL